MISDAFIGRRIGTCLLALGLVRVGAVAYTALPVAPLPQVDFPTIEVNATLPGASAETMASSVATPLERQFSDISGVTEMTSSSSLGRTQITLQFDLNRNIDGAAQDVQTAINAAGGQLPKDLPQPPTYEKVNPASAAILSIALTSDVMPLTELGSVAEDLVTPQLAQITGVGLIDYHGQLRPSVRVQVNPDKLAGLGLTMDDVRTVISQQTIDQPKGTLDGRHHAIVLNATDQLQEPQEYRSLVLAYRNGAPVMLDDVAKVVSAPEDIHEAAWLQGQRTVIVDIHQQPGFNVVATIAKIKSLIPGIAASLPAAAHMHVVSDRTQTIQASVHDVQLTMMITIALVVMVIFCFLRSLWATVIPSLTIPLCLMSTFGAMYVLGYSLDNLSLMGLTIAVGFVVDDAIVVIENIIRHMEKGTPRLQAARDGVREVGSTIISMTLSLIAVFIPILLMGDVIGRLFREFAATVAVAVITSGVVSLTVTPMLCGWVLKHRPESERGRLFKWSEHVFERTLAGYARLLDVVLRHRHVTLGLVLVVMAATGALYVVSPKGFFPQEDSGLILGVAKAAPDISFSSMSDKIQRVGRIIQADPDVSAVYFWIGANPTVSNGRIIINLKPFATRTTSAPKVLNRLRNAIKNVEGMTVGLQVYQDIQIGARVSATQYQYTLQGPDNTQLDHWAGIMKKRLSALPQLRDVVSDREASAQSARFVIDRTTASRLGVSVQAIDDTLYDAFGQRQIATLFTSLNQYHVVEEVQPNYQLDVGALSHLYVRSSTTQQLVPLSLLGTVKNGVSPVTINHQSLFPSITLSFNLAPGYALSDAVTAIRKTELAAGMPTSIIASFQGTAQAFQKALTSEPLLILAAIIAVYIVLGVLYESAIHPLTIISTLPSAGLGALLALRLSGQELSIMGMIGIILLIGIVKKNAIMMIDFAIIAEREQHMTPVAAIRQACLLRFRPIMMTTMAALLGALPLALGTGAGAELRTPLGIAIVGGLVVSQALTLFTTPVIYLAFDRLERLLRPEAHARGEPAASGRP